MYKIIKILFLPIEIILLGCILFYKVLLSPIFGNGCIYFPTCSSYTYESLIRFGTIKGGFLSFKRIIRCNKFYKGGYDPIELDLRGDYKWII